MDSTHQYLVEEELEHFRDGLITRREFVRRATQIGAAAVTAAAMTQGIIPRVASAAPATQLSPFSVAAADPSVASDMISYVSSDGAELAAYLAWPSGASENASLPGIVVCHPASGLTDHVMDVARRYAKQGYVAIAPDLVSRLGTPTASLSPDDLRLALGRLMAVQSAQDLKAALTLLRGHAAVDPAKTAATGYCSGGGLTWRLATIDEDLTAAAPYYGSAPPIEDVPRMKAAMLGVYAGNDERVNATSVPLEAAMTGAGVRFQLNVYPGAEHGFHEDGGRVYHREAAIQAYTDTLNWFAQYLDLPAPTL